MWGLGVQLYENGQFQLGYVYPRLVLGAQKPGFTRFVAKTYQSRFTHFWGKISNFNLYLCKKFDILQLCIKDPMESVEQTL